MSSIPNNQQWVDFFNTLKELPELWKVKSDIFKDRNKKMIAWSKLLDVYKRIEPNANIDSLKSRLTNIRTCFRRELKKVQHSQMCGVDEYVPNLWYYEALHFLRDEEQDSVDLNQSVLSFYHDDSENVPSTPASYSWSHKRKKPIVQHSTERNGLLKEVLGQLAKKDPVIKDEASVFAESWATSYRKLNSTQQIYAKKAIEEILVLGQLELLGFNSVNVPTSNCSSLQQSRIDSPIIIETPSSPSFKND